MTARTKGSVRIIGAGLLGTSIGLALRKHDIDVIVEDASPAVQALAIDYGAGRAPRESDDPAIIIVCVPPDVTAIVIERELKAFPRAVVTDVASVKSQILNSLESSNSLLENYVGSHPMAGREKGGAISGRADLFVGRPWIISATARTSAAASTAIENLALDLGASPVSLTASEHDRAVALVSHLPQIISSILAARLVEGEDKEIALAGQGLRDTTRIAASDPKLWLQILSANSNELRGLLEAFSADLDSVISALADVSASGSLAKLSKALESGNRGVERIPGKHGTKATEYAQVIVMIDDRPGELARLLTEVGEIGINLEELKLEHSPSALIGLVELSVIPSAESKLIDDLTSRGWRLAG